MLSPALDLYFVVGRIHRSEPLIGFPHLRRTQSDSFTISFEGFTPLSESYQGFVPKRGSHHWFILWMDELLYHLATTVEDTKRLKHHLRRGVDSEKPTDRVSDRVARGTGAAQRQRLRHFSAPGRGLRLALAALGRGRRLGAWEWTPAGGFRES